jgi:hypothetical protein
MVEFALLLPIFLVVLFLIIDFGVGISRWVIVTNSTREGARIGAVGASIGDIRDKVAVTSNGLLDATDVTVRYVGDGDGKAERGESVVVESDYEYGLITPLSAFTSITFDTLTFHSCTDMRLELPVSGANDSGGDVCS